MKIYHYQARDKEGNKLTGEIEADSERQVVGLLKGKGVIITEVVEQSDSLWWNLVSAWKKPSLEDIANFTRQLATMVSSGLALVDALRILAGQSKPAMAKVVQKTLQSVEGGSTLSQSLLESGGNFTPVYIALVTAGETTGSLDTILKKLAETLDKQRDFQNKTKGALIYPAIIMVGMVVVTIIMMVFVVPKMTEIYKDFGAELPLPTKILMSVSSFMVWGWPFLVLGGGLLVVAVKKWIKTELGGLLFEQLMLKIPVWGKLKKDIILTEFARTMGLLVTAGISVLDGLRIVADTLGSRIYGEGVKQSALLVEKGISLSESVSSVVDFPPILSQMVAVGEQTGKLDEVLVKLADYYEEESAVKVKALTTAIEPVVMIFMGVGVGFLVLAVIMPIYNLTSQF